MIQTVELCCGKKEVWVCESDVVMGGDERGERKRWRGNEVGGATKKAEQQTQRSGPRTASVSRNSGLCSRDKPVSCLHGNLAVA